MTAVATLFERLNAELLKLELENSGLRKAVSDLTLDKLILQEASRGNF
jgi:putative transposase